MTISSERLFQPFFALFIINGFVEVLPARLLLLPFTKDTLHDLGKQILGHQEFTVFRFDCKNFNAEVQNVSNIFAACVQISHFFAKFDGFGDLSLKFQLTLLEQRLLDSLAFPVCLELAAHRIDKFTSI